MKKPPRIEEVKLEEDPVRKAFLAGYWIGYTGSSEWVGRGNELKRLVLNWAEHSGKLGEALKAYRAGKNKGRALKEGEILRRLSYKINGEKGGRARTPVVLVSGRRSRKSREKILNRVSVLNIPGVLKRRKMLRSPGFLWRGL
ncbi:hypothetical protein [Thermococcus sp.]|uniref:hypothetical protein n=1 Tax=Thermococcus sp. TaxID=35749 RepID=UPI002612E393|nr:hypothetical protein [Thermococcus sp.]